MKTAASSEAENSFVLLSKKLFHVYSTSFSVHLHMTNMLLLILTGKFGQCLSLLLCMVVSYHERPRA